MLIINDRDEKEILIEVESTKNLEDITKKEYFTGQENKGNNDQEYSVNNIMLEMLNELINKVLVEEIEEIWEINQKYNEITTKLFLIYNDWLESINRMTGKRLMSLEEKNDESYQYISELN